MGRFKNENTLNPINEWLLKQGYEKRIGVCGEKGLTKVYHVDDDFYYVWVTININQRKIYIYKEYNCGGMIGETEIDIKKEWLDSLNDFIDNVDDVLECWISE